MAATALMNSVSLTLIFTYAKVFALHTYIEHQLTLVASCSYITPSSAKLLGLKRSPPPFLFLLTLKSHHFKKHLYKGVNFASGGAGLLDLTNFGMVKP